MIRQKIKKFTREEMVKIPGFIYCGRDLYGWPRSPLHNPFKSGIHGTAEECCDLFYAYIMQRIEWEHPAILEAFARLAPDSVLGCWCEPDEPCHCDVIIGVWNILHAADAV